MTQETDEVSQDQDRLDAEQGIDAGIPAGPLTAEQVTAIVEAQLRPIVSDLRGIQGMNDRAANAIRRDVTADIESRIGNLKGNLDRQAYLSTLDAHDREVVEPLLKMIDAGQPPQLQAAPAPIVAASQQAGTPDQWEIVKRTVRNVGVKDDDPRVRYDILVDASLTQEQRESRFLGHLGDLRQAGTSSTRQPVDTPAPQDNTSNPPVENGNVGVGAITSLDSLQDALIGGHITTDQFREQAAAKGWSV
jgi:hypothetical protein